MPKPQSLNARDFQERIERHTMDLLDTEAVQAAKQSGEQALLASISDADAASVERFAEIAQEITLNALIGFADGYAGQDLPRLIMRAPRQLDGRRVPGNRGLHDNPDTFYRLVPLDGRSDFLLVGKVSAAPATVFELSALTSEWQTLANMTREDLGIAPGSEFRIRFSPEQPTEAGDAKKSVDGAGGASLDARRGDRHVHISPDAEMLLVRETLADWARERPSELVIENYTERGGEREIDPPDFIAGAAARVAKWFSESIRLTKLPLSQPANFFPTPVISGEHGKLVTMAYSIGHFWIRPNQALVLTIHPGPAEYVGVPITNIWGTTNGNLDSTASLNNQQAVANADGSFTCVLSLEDPGVANWLDPDGLERGFIFLRWANLDASQRPSGPPAIKSQIVSLKALSDVLPRESPGIAPHERAALTERRKAEHALRFAAPSTAVGPS